jgi:NTP pyrophosphatase (non-canonical NTP hydrolase)
MVQTLMTIDEYSRNANRTANKSLSPDIRIVYNALKAAGEAGEIADLVGKWIGQGHELDRERVIKEMGDVLWHLNDLADGLGITLNDVAQMNIEKLRGRYPDGFSVERSISRSD